MCVYDRRVLLPREAEQGETRDVTVHVVAGQEGRRSSMRESMTPDVRARWAALLPVAGQMSVEELLALPEHRWRYELLAGKLTQRPPSDLLYDMMVHMLVSALRDFARTAGIVGTTLQETGVVISATGEPDTVFVPALAFIRSAQMSIAEPLAEMLCAWPGATSSRRAGTNMARCRRQRGMGHLACPPPSRYLASWAEWTSERGFKQ